MKGSNYYRPRDILGLSTAKFETASENGTAFKSAIPSRLKVCEWEVFI